MLKDFAKSMSNVEEMVAKQGFKGNSLYLF
jgi:hypothetical protein